MNVDSELVAEFWKSGFGDAFLARTSVELSDLVPDELVLTREWRKMLNEASIREAELDRRNSESCVLHALAQHAFRAGARVPFLEEPLLLTDPALAAAVALLRNPGWYSSALAGKLP
jgi:hypothetical protein